MWGLCKYKDAIGKPNTGMRKKYRIFNIPIIDTVVTLLFVWFISYYYKYSFINVLGITFIAMIIAHRAFCVRSATDTLLFPDK
jgi:uncharacterized membrane protein